MGDKSKKLIYLEKILKFFAARIIKKYKPKIIGITGSVGKTSAKEAIYAALKNSFSTRKGEKNYNNEIGIPLTVVGAASGGKSLFRWFLVFAKALGILIFPVKYPRILVLEMGADRSGDLEYLTSFIKPNLAVITDVSGSHLEFFKTIEGVAKEKSVLVKELCEKGAAILNIDNDQICKIKNQLANSRKDLKILGFGFSEEADILATDVHYNYSNGDSGGPPSIKGISFKLTYKGTTMPMRLNHIVAKHNVYAALAAISCGLELGLNLVEIAKNLEDFCLPFGRMTLIPGIKNSFIIDDTYNSSPVSALAALDIMKEIKAERKIVVMGDMLELGELSEKGHEDVARKFLDVKADIFFAVGKRMNMFAAAELKKHNISPERLFSFASPIDAGKKLQEIMREGDLVLVKGSQGMRMEKVVEEVMLEPDKVCEFLCRQDTVWREKPWKEV